MSLQFLRTSHALSLRTVLLLAHAVATALLFAASVTMVLTGLKVEGYALCAFATSVITFSYVLMIYDRILAIRDQITEIVDAKLAYDKQMIAALFGEPEKGEKQWTT